MLIYVVTTQSIIGTSTVSKEMIELNKNGISEDMKGSLRVISKVS